jgi:DNA-binding Lrp family transcriptional regulator
LPRGSGPDVRSRAESAAQDAIAEDAAVARIVWRLSGTYVLRAFQMAIDAFGDIRAGLLVQVINAANTAPLANTETAWRVVGPDGTFPDDIRRPISVSRLADATGVPFESVRRIVRRLIDEDVCIRVEGGVIVPRRVIEGPETARAVMANVGYVRRTVRDLLAAGLTEAASVDPALAGEEPSCDPATVRAVAGRSIDYVLRFLGLLPEMFGDVRAGVVAVTILAANTDHLDKPNGEGSRYAGLDENPPDDVRKPISVSRLAGTLGIPFETMRRQVGRLVDGGVCLRVAGGVIVPAAVMEGPAALRAKTANVAYVRKFLRDLQAVSGPAPACLERV